MCALLLVVLHTCLSATSPIPSETGRASDKDEGIWISNEPEYRTVDDRRRLLVERLREITGWSELDFEEDGRLAMGNTRHARNGSATAREIFYRALCSGDRFVIEDHSDSAAVAFGQIDEGTRYEDLILGRNLNIWQIRLDFRDFERMTASPELREAFDVGLTMIHELLHGLGYRDTQVYGAIGECEQLVNQIRADLGLPLRAQYHGERVFQLPHLLSVRLRFTIPARSSQPRGSRARSEYVVFVLPRSPGDQLNDNAGESAARAMIE